MLVKDIELIPAILDLVDNSIDGAKRITSSRKKARFEGLYVRLAVDGSRFVIEDNCGGIPANHAREYAFRFGRSSKMSGSIGEVGQFGVGMKRALFKIGGAFWIESIAAESRFVLPVDVRNWEKDKSPDWTFEFEELDESTHHSIDECMTKIEVTKLHPSVSVDFTSASFLSRLRAALELRHQDALQKGIELRLGNSALRPITPLLRSSSDFAPIHIERDFPVGKKKVHMALFAGVDGGQSIEVAGDSETEAETIRQPSRAGWYLFCNDRLLFAADQSPLTGWGNAAAAYHPQYRLFRGYVYLSANDSSLLPWNTTKTGVDEDSALFRSVQGEMFNALRMVQAILNRAKDERQTRDPDDRPVLAAMAAANSVPARSVPASSIFVAPSDPPRIKRKTQKGKRIAYNVDEDAFDLVSVELGTENGADIGRLTFQYYFDNEVPED